MFCKAWHTTEFAVAHHTELPIGFASYDAAQTAVLMITLGQSLLAKCIPCSARAAGGQHAHCPHICRHLFPYFP